VAGNICLALPAAVEWSGLSFLRSLAHPAATASASVLGRKVKLKAKLEISVSICTFQELEPGTFNTSFNSHQPTSGELSPPIGTSRYCTPRHRHAFGPLFLELKRRGVL